MAEVEDPGYPESSPTVRLEHLAGLLLLALVASGLGAPIPGTRYLTDALLVLVGFGLARTILSHTDEDAWVGRYLAVNLGRLMIPVVLVVGLVSLYVLASPTALATLPTSQLGGSQILTALSASSMTLNIASVGSAVESFAEIDHLWLISLIAQAAVLAPLLILGQRQRLGRRRRTILLAGAGLTVALVRLALLFTSAMSTQSIDMMLRADALLVGVALGIMPIATYHRHPVTRLAYPAAALLIAVVLLPFARIATAAGLEPSTWAIIDRGVFGPIAIGLAIVIVWAIVAGRLPYLVARLIERRSLAWFCRRGVGIYAWHLPFRYLLGDDPSSGWPGTGVFITGAALTFAAAAIGYRSIEAPLLESLQSSPNGLRRAHHPSTKFAGQKTRQRATRRVDGADTPSSSPAALEPMQKIQRRPRPVPSPDTGGRRRPLPSLPRTKRRPAAASEQTDSGPDTDFTLSA